MGGPCVLGGLFDQPPVKLRDFGTSACSYKILVQDGNASLSFDSMSLSQARTPAFRAPGAKLSRVRTRDYQGSGRRVVTLNAVQQEPPPAFHNILALSGRVPDQRPPAPVAPRRR